MSLNLSPNSISLWQSAIVRDSLRLSDGKPTEGGWYELKFGYLDLHTFKITLDETDPMTSLRLSHLLSNGHRKAGYTSISDHKYLRGVKSVSVSGRKEDKFGNIFFIVTLNPTEEHGPLATPFEIEPRGNIEKYHTD